MSTSPGKFRMPAGEIRRASVTDEALEAFIDDHVAFLLHGREPGVSDDAWAAECAESELTNSVVTELLDRRRGEV